MCLDNKFSQFSSKTVYLEVSIDVNSEGYRWDMINEAFEKDKTKRDTINLLKVCLASLHTERSNLITGLEDSLTLQRPKIHNKTKCSARV